jgi:DNA polymerase III delta prime subunit
MNFHDFLGNTRVAETLRRLVVEDTLPQTLLFSGPRGVGKATLARIVAAAINCDQGRGEICGACSNCLRILRADLSGDEFQTQLEARDKLTSVQRAENPLIVSTHPDFLIFPPTDRCGSSPSSRRVVCAMPRRSDPRRAGIVSS